MPLSRMALINPATKHQRSCGSIWLRFGSAHELHPSLAGHRDTGCGASLPRVFNGRINSERASPRFLGRRWRAGECEKWSRSGRKKHSLIIAMLAPAAGARCVGAGDPVVPCVRDANCGHRPAMGSHASGMLKLRVPFACSGSLNKARPMPRWGSSATNQAISPSACRRHESN